MQIEPFCLHTFCLKSCIFAYIFRFGMKIKEVIEALERFAPLPLQEEYDNSGLQTGTTETEVSGALLCLDVTLDVVREAAQSGCNLIISHHPLIFRPIRKITTDTIGSIIIEAIRNGITIYASHTNLDNAPLGVNRRIADILNLTNVRALNENGSGIIGELSMEMPEESLLALVRDRFSVPCIKHNSCLGRNIRQVAVCGGSGAFLIDNAVEQGADAFITGEIGYHRMFGYDGVIKLMEIGHFESEQFTVDLIQDILKQDCPELKTVKTGVITNPVRCFV